MEKASRTAVILVLVMVAFLITIIPNAAVADEKLKDYSCPDGQILKVQDGSWECAKDENTLQYLSSCQNDDVAKYNNGVWYCADDEDRDTMGDLSASCSSGQVAKWNNDSQQWECANDSGSDWQLISWIETPTIAPQNSYLLTITCLSGKRAISGGFEIWGTDHVIVRSSKPYQNLNPLDSWYVEFYNPAATDTVTPNVVIYAICVDR